MNWPSGDDSRPFPSSYDIGPAVGTGTLLEATQSHEWNQQNGAVSTTDIPLLNDDHEKAILSDLCRTAGTESTPLTTFSYISEYICSNNIDIWPGELPGSSDVSGGKVNSAEHNIGEQRFPRASCMHQQIYFKCKRVLESIITRNDQILALLRHKKSTNKAVKRLL
ncbi:uncharacterized protein LOC126559984 [Anopheles maculipalpis]|uniref:uncharacterized protein LOC126559984 n=1 Tax=Anopheles maculipalpis TaxID=1496333 RepID=UPI002159956B|nr:uncharacterized protein LOC126559984 [Anopheles maculipalpis]